MTIVRGVHILASPCCGARYVAPQYLSMNFSAFEYWTDGWRDGSLMPNDEGLRRCQCGKWLLMNQFVQVDTAESSDLPRIPHVRDNDLDECIAHAPSTDVEIAARVGLWRSLNHGYRESYRVHRAAEEAATRAAWEVANPDRRTWWDKFLKHKPPQYCRPSDSPFTVPPYTPTAQQRENMARLSALLSPCVEVSETGDHNRLLLSELYREQGLFGLAQAVLGKDSIGRDEVTWRLMSRLIQEQQTAPIRYRM